MISTTFAMRPLPIPPAQDAADRGRLSAGTFKRLNLGLAGLELSYAAVFGGNCDPAGAYLMSMKP